MYFSKVSLKGIWSGAPPYGSCMQTLLHQLSQPSQAFEGFMVETGHMFLKQPPCNISTGGPRECGGPLTPVVWGWDKVSVPSLSSPRAHGACRPHTGILGQPLSETAT